MHQGIHLRNASEQDPVDVLRVPYARLARRGPSGHRLPQPAARSFGPYQRLLKKGNSDEC